MFPILLLLFPLTTSGQLIMNDFVVPGKEKSEKSFWNPASRFENDQQANEGYPPPSSTPEAIVYPQVEATTVVPGPPIHPQEQIETYKPIENSFTSLPNTQNQQSQQSTDEIPLSGGFWPDPKFIYENRKNGGSHGGSNNGGGTNSGGLGENSENGQGSPNAAIFVHHSDGSNHKFTSGGCQAVGGCKNQTTNEEIPNLNQNTTDALWPRSNGKSLKQTSANKTTNTGTDQPTKASGIITSVPEQVEAQNGTSKPKIDETTTTTTTSSNTHLFPTETLRSTNNVLQYDKTTISTIVPTTTPHIIIQQTIPSLTNPKETILTLPSETEPEYPTTITSLVFIQIPSEVPGFLSDSPENVIRRYYEILQNPDLSKSLIKEKLEQWSNSLSPQAKTVYDDSNNSRMKLINDHNRAWIERMSGMDKEAQQVAQQIMAIRQNDQLTIQEESNLIENIMRNIPENVRKQVGR